MRRNLLGLMSLCLLLTGCWDQRELSTVVLVTGMAIDKGKSGRYKLSVLALNAAEMNEQTAQGNSPTGLFSLEGDTIAELSQKMNIAYSKKLIYSHMKVLVIGEDIAKDGVLAFLDYLERNREIREDIAVTLAKEGEAKDILSIVTVMQKDPGIKLQEQLKRASEVWGLSPDVKLHDLLEAITSPGREPVMTAVRVKGDVKKGEAVDNMKKPKPDALIIIDSLALFHDQKLIGFLSEEGTRNYLWTQNKVDYTTLSIPCEEKKYATVGITDSVTRLKGKIQNGQPKIRIDISMESVLLGTNCGYPMDKPDSYKKIEKLTGKFIQENIGKTIKTVQKDYGADIFGFGEVVYRQDYKQFKKVQDHWNEAFKEAEIDVHANVVLNNSGIRVKGALDR